ncbi:hypothetical protein MRX96_021526 [Rhipicephalus microplus]
MRAPSPGALLLFLTLRCFAMRAPSLASLLLFSLIFHRSPPAPVARRSAAVFRGKEECTLKDLCTPRQETHDNSRLKNAFAFQESGRPGLRCSPELGAEPNGQVTWQVTLDFGCSRGSGVEPDGEVTWQVALGSTVHQDQV